MGCCCNCCGHEAYREVHVHIDDFGRDQHPLIVGKAPLPPQLRGVFWLTEQENSSALMSFGGPNSDGCGASTGKLEIDGKYKIYCAGDRIWSVHEPDAWVGPHGFWTRCAGYYYNFKFDDSEDPQCAQIWPTLENLCCYFVPSCCLKFEMHLSTTEPEYPGSYVWKRVSYQCGKVLEEAAYDLVQVIDENGKRIEPAFSLCEEYMKDEKHYDADGTGNIWIRGIESECHEIEEDQDLV